MCRIVAFFSRCLPMPEAVLQRANQSLDHRGPDGQRHWMSEDNRVALGHSRLSIIDLTTGDQPIASEDGRTRIVVNGEFYGYEAIQRELEGSGHRLRAPGQTARSCSIFMKTSAPNACTACAANLLLRLGMILIGGSSRPATGSVSSRCSTPSIGRHCT